MSHSQQYTHCALPESRSRLLAFVEVLKRFIESIAGRGMEGSDSEAEFAKLALELFAIQYESVPVYGAFCRRRGWTPHSVTRWQDIPALPTGAFKEHELTSLPPEWRTTVFYSSGTTQPSRSRHFHNADSLTLYRDSILPWFSRHVLPEHEKLTSPVASMDGNARFSFLFLTPSPEHAPHSSLVHMMRVLRDHWGGVEATFAGRADESGGWTLDFAQIQSVVEQAIEQAEPVVLLGTAFSLVQWMDSSEFGKDGMVLPAESRVMETGGYKGRSRVVPKDELHQLIVQRLGIPLSHIVCEYGMSELSSQAYDGVVAGQAEGVGSERRSFRFPPWARCQVMSPESGEPVKDGEVGLIQILDLANAFSLLSVQTEDLAVGRGAGFELLGRAGDAEPRGCSLRVRGS